MTSYALNEPQLDWVTLTRPGRLGECGLAGNLLSWGGVSRNEYAALDLLNLSYRGGIKYLGRQFSTPYGSCGLYEDSDRNRSMITISSSMAHLTRGEWLPFVGSGDWSTTRLDIAITVAATFNPLDLVALLHGRRSVSFLSSNDTKHDGDTVYIGSKKSERYGVVYEKKKGEHLRLELRNMGDYAKRVGEVLANRNTTTHEDILDGTLSTWVRGLPVREAADGIIKKFDLGGYKSKLEYIVDNREEERRAKWLLDVAWPSIRRTVLAGEYPAGELFTRMTELFDEMVQG